MGRRYAAEKARDGFSAQETISLEQEWKQVIRHKPPAAREAWLRRGDVIAKLTAKVCAQRRRGIEDQGTGLGLLAPSPYWYRAWLYGGQTPPMRLTAGQIERLASRREGKVDKKGRINEERVIARHAASFLRGIAKPQSGTQSRFDGGSARMVLSKVATRAPLHWGNSDQDTPFVVLGDTPILERNDELTRAHRRFYPAMAVTLEDALDGADQFAGDRDQQQFTRDWLNDDNQCSCSAVVIQRIADAGGHCVDGLRRLKDPMAQRGGVFYSVIPKKGEI